MDKPIDPKEAARYAPGSFGCHEALHMALVLSELVAEVTTGNGRIWLPGGRAGAIAVEGATARDAPVWVQSERDGLFEDGVEGLLGLSFLGNFRVVLTPGAVTLAPLN